VLGGIAPEDALTDQVLVEAAKRRDTTGDARGPEAADPQALEVLDDVVGPDPTETLAVIAQELEEIGEIAPVCVESIPGRPPLSLKGAEILDDRIGHRVTTSDSITMLDNREARASRNARVEHSAPDAAGVAP
jgi:hypothetical protein